VSSATRMACALTCRARNAPGSTPVSKIRAQVQLTDVSQVGLTQDEASVIGHPHAQDLVMLAPHDLLGKGPLLGTIWRLAQRGCQGIDDGVIEAEIFLATSSAYTDSAFVETHRVPVCPPRPCRPISVGIAAKVGRIMVLVIFSSMLRLRFRSVAPVGLGGHAGKVLIVEQRRLKAMGIARPARRCLAASGRYCHQGRGRRLRPFILEIKIRNAPAGTACPSKRVSTCFCRSMAIDMAGVPARHEKAVCPERRASHTAGPS